MGERAPARIGLCATAAVLIASFLIAGRWGWVSAAGVLAGGIWNLASVACLSRLLQSWLGPHRSHSRVIVWLLLKVLLFSLLLIGIPRASLPLLVGFSIGFSIALAVIMGGGLLQARHLSTAPPHGR